MSVSLDNAELADIKKRLANVESELKSTVSVLKCIHFIILKLKNKSILKWRYNRSNWSKIKKKRSNLSNPWKKNWNHFFRFPPPNETIDNVGPLKRAPQYSQLIIYRIFFDSAMIFTMKNWANKFVSVFLFFKKKMT